MSSDRLLKRVLFVRHGQGHHNLTDANGKQNLHLFNLTLTAQGEAEARAVFTANADVLAPAFHPDAAFVSPMHRTLQTCTIAMAALGPARGGSAPVFAIEEAREGNNHSACNHRDPIDAGVRAAFPTVDFSLLADAAGPAHGEEG